MGKSMWQKHRSVFQDHVKYIHNNIIKAFRIIILQYDESVLEMNDISKYFIPPYRKVYMLYQIYWRVKKCEFTKYEIHVAIKDSLPESMKDDMEDKYWHYSSLPHE